MKSRLFTLILLIIVMSLLSVTMTSAQGLLPPNIRERTCVFEITANSVEYQLGGWTVAFDNDYSYRTSETAPVRIVTGLGKHLISILPPNDSAVWTAWITCTRPGTVIPLDMEVTQRCVQ